MLTGTAVYGTVRTVVWEDGGGDPASYPIAPGMARGAQAPSNQVWCLIGDLEVQVLFGP